MHELCLGWWTNEVIAANKKKGWTANFVQVWQRVIRGKHLLLVFLYCCAHNHIGQKGIICWLVLIKIQWENELERVFHGFIIGGRSSQRLEHRWSRAFGHGILHDVFSIVKHWRCIQQDQMGDGIWITKGVLQGNESPVGVPKHRHFPETEMLPQAFSIISQLGMGHGL